MSTELISVVIETQPTVTNVTVTPPIEYQVNFYDIAVVDPSVNAAKVSAQAAATAAASSASAASGSASSAATSETNAASAQTATAASASAASSSADAAAGSESAAAMSATSAATSEENALSYKNAANTSATNAATSEANALASKNAAATSASNAATSATNAATSATNASTTFDTKFATKTTADLPENTNLYWTAARFDTRLALKTTADITENTSFKYFTDARAQTATVINSTAGAETVQAASVAAMKSYVAANAGPPADGSITEVKLDSALDAKVTGSLTTKFSSSTAALTYAGSGTYTLTTLSGAPVGTYITFTYAASGNVRTQTTVRPAQSDANMSTQGMNISSRAYASASTATSPACFAVQIGTSLKSFRIDLYGASTKTVPCDVGRYIVSAAASTSYGISEVIYDPQTGILIVDAGFAPGQTTASVFLSNTIGTITNGYLWITGFGATG